jgi:hypothetical protein
MDVDPSWSFDDYQAYERARLDESLAEQRGLRRTGWRSTPSPSHMAVTASHACGPPRSPARRPLCQPAGRSAARDPRLPVSSQRWQNTSDRELILWSARVVEAEPSLLGLSAHLLAVARRRGRA